MKFALEREEELLAAIERANKNSNLSSLHDLLNDFSAQGKKNLKLIERTRRENINEVVLQPISGLNAADYVFGQISAESSSQADFSNYLKNSIAKISNFYNDAADRLPVDEAKRLFRQIAKKRTL